MQQLLWFQQCELAPLGALSQIAGVQPKNVCYVDTKLFEVLLNCFPSCQSLLALQHSSFQTVAPAEGAAEQRGSQAFESPCSAGKEAATKHFLEVAFQMLGNETDFGPDDSDPEKLGLPVS